MKEMIRVEYLRRVKLLARSKLNGWECDCWGCKCVGDWSGEIKYGNIGFG